jgi:Zn-dependent protease with chaperone function
MSFYRVNRTESLGDVRLGIPHFFKYFFGWWCWVYFVAMDDRLQFGDLLMDVCRRFFAVCKRFAVKGLLICLLGLGAEALLAQGGNANVKVDFEHYRGAVCSGELPIDFKISSVKKVDDAMSELKNKELGRKEAALEKEHLIKSVFAIDDLLMSGRILYGDPMSDFVEAVGQKLLAANDRGDLMESLRFYVLKSNEVNAYATSNGVVIVTVGLLSRIENESQLAFILAHEIQHYIQKHSLQQFKHRKTTKKRVRGVVTDGDVQLKDVYQFSKENEMEADEKGFEMMVRSGYDLLEGVFVFDMLKYGDYPFMEAKLALDSFEFGEYVFPKTLKDAVKTAVASAEIEDSKYLEGLGDDDNSTHPSLDRRVVRLRDMIEGVEKGERSFFLVGDARFALMQKMARHELLLVYMQRADYGQLMYLTHVMRELYGESVFFDQAEAMGLYGLLMHKVNEHDLNRYGCDMSSSRGEWRPFIGGLRELDVKGLSAFGMKRMWEMWKRGTSQDDFFGKVCKAYFVMAQRDGNFRLQDFLDYLPAAEFVKADSAQGVADPNEGKLKNPRSRVARSRAANVVSGDYYMAIYYQSPEKAKLQEFIDQMKWSEDLVITKAGADKVAKSKRKRFVGVRDLKHLVMFEPHVELTMGNNESSSRNPFIEVEKRNEVVSAWENAGQRMRVDVNVLPGSTGVQGLTTEKLNQFVQVNDWMMERMNNDTQAMILFGSQFITEAMGGEDYRHLAWVGYESSAIRRKFEPGAMALSMVLYPMFPYYLYYQLGVEKDWDEFLLVYDVKTGSIVQVKEADLSHRWTKDFVNSRIYNHLYYIIHGGK